MHSPDVIAEVLRLRDDEGLGARRISRKTGLSISTIRDWLAGRLPQHKGAHNLDDAACSQCGVASHDFESLPPDYAYLLGLYLGDGCISAHPRGVFRLRITLDCAYPAIIDSGVAAAARVSGGVAAVHKRKGQNCVDVSSYWKSWPCFLPQHGPGPKHARAIVLTEWQRQLVQQGPDQLLKGLIHSDGCRFINTGRRWICPRYLFTNHSDDIRAIFCDACEQMGVHWTSSGRYTIYVSRKADVATLDSFIGPKR